MPIKLNSPSGCGSAIGELRTSRPPEGTWPRMALAAYGGTTLYGKTEQVLHKGLKCVEEGIASVAKDNLCLIRQVLKGYVSRRLQCEISDKVFGAVLGRCLRKGKIECVPGLTIHRKVRWMYLSHENLPVFAEMMGRVRTLLESHTAVSTNAIQEACFPSRNSGSWFMAQQIAEHLAYLGRAVYVDKDLFLWPEVFRNAERKNL